MLTATGSSSRGFWALALVGGVAGGCSFIDSFDYTFVDDAGGSDGGLIDGGADARVAEGGTPDATGRDASGPRMCTVPCVSDAILDYDPATQGSSAGEWRYTQDFRATSGLTYGDLIAGDLMGVPAWTDGSPPPAIASCVGQSGNAPCQVAGDRVLMLANDPGAGADPVIEFTAPMSGSFNIHVDHVGNGDQMELLVSRNARHDVVGSSSFLPSAVEASFTVPVDLLEGDRLLVTARPARMVTAAGQLGVSVRVVQDASTAALADCVFAARFDDPMPFVDGCGSSTIEDPEEGMADATTGIVGPNPALGQARSFDTGSLLRVPDARFDYSEDFTVQMWVRIDSNNNFSTAIYADWSAFDPATAGGVALSIDPNDGMGTDDIVTAGFLFSDLANSTPSTPPTIDCESDGYCTGTIVTTIPSFLEWHFYRIVRDSDADVVRLCIDGIEVGTAPLDGSVDLSNPRSPTFGTFGFSPQENFRGAIDDVRILSRALPCADPP